MASPPVNQYRVAGGEHAYCSRSSLSGDVGALLRDNQSISALRPRRHRALDNANEETYLPFAVGLQVVSFRNSASSSGAGVDR
jgi:hypothetical protein